MQAWPISAWWMAALLVFVVSSAVTAWSLAYARRRNLLDHPGQRRSHSMPTPRGGGIGIVVGVLVGNAAVFFGSMHSDAWQMLPLSASVLLVAAVGWIDDHRGLSAKLRFAVHCLAAMVLLGWFPVATWLFNARSDTGGNEPWFFPFLILSIATVWSINLHNFMDGIDGLLASQALFVFVALALLCAQAGCLAEAGQIGVFAAATLGFLPFNFPRARIFMGDVGSGVLGSLVIIAVMWSMLVSPLAMASGLIACSAFVVDASATLLSRMFSGRRWYSAHREHLYQWLVRSGWTHAQVTGMYMGWNLLLPAPVLYWINREPAMPTDGWMATSWFVEQGVVELVLVYALAALAWIIGKRHCLYKMRHRSRGIGAQ